MTDPDANPTKPRPHGLRRLRKLPLTDTHFVVASEPEEMPPAQPTACRLFIDPEQHITADEAERFTEEYAKRMGIK